MIPTQNHAVTGSLVWATLVSCMSTLQFGFHLSIFNAPQEIISCQKSVPGPLSSYADTLWSHLALEQCIPMNVRSIASINTMFTLGGLISSSVVGFHQIDNTFGRKRLQKISAFSFFTGSLIIALSNNILWLDAGRFLTGFAAGSCMVTAPILISEITPSNHRGLMGSLLQFGVAIGILSAQLIAFPWSNDQQWRNLFAAGSLLGLVQFLLLFSTVESPKWIIMKRGDVTRATEILHTLRSDEIATHHEINHWRRLSSSCNDPKEHVSEATSLLESQEEEIVVPTISLADYLSKPKYRKEIAAVFILMAASQLCGMNAITFYGVSIVSKVMPEKTNVLYLTSFLAFTNAISAISISPLIDKWGRRPLLLLSTATMALLSVVISFGLVHNFHLISAFGCFGFVVGYSIGLGQIPFLMISEVSSGEAVGMAQSLGAVCNWIASMSIAFLFPPLKEYFGGFVFLVFAGLGAVLFVSIYVCVPETMKKVAYSEIWRGYSQKG